MQLQKLYHGIMNLQEEQQQMRLRVQSREPLLVTKTIRAKTRRAKMRKEMPVYAPPVLNPDALTQTEQKVLEVIQRMGVDRVYRNGWPDFIVRCSSTSKRKGKVVFVEVKSGTNDFPTPSQVAVHELLRDLGFTVLVVDGTESEMMLDYRLRKRLN